MAFVKRVGELAEREGHHPDLSLGWGYATVTYYTHKIGGLHENDFVMAAKVNELCV
jgi:4a-hydroxytetrahydrobiopterin dehydratase